MDAKLNIEREDMALLGEVNLSLRLQKRKVCHLFSVEATSEGYETMTEASEVIGHRPVKTCLLGGGHAPVTPPSPSLTTWICSKLFIMEPIHQLASGWLTFH